MPDLDDNRPADADFNNDIDINAGKQPEKTSYTGYLAPADPQGQLDCERLRQIMLRKLQDNSGKLLKAQIVAFFAQISAVQLLCGWTENRSDRIAIMTKDWRLSRAEALRLHRLSNLSEDDQAFYLDNLVSPEMIFALHKQQPEVREEAHLLISAGRVLHASDLTQMRRRRLAARPEFARAEDNRFVRAQAKRGGADLLTVLTARIEKMVRLLALAYNKTWSANRERRKDFLQAVAMRSATDLLFDFNALFPVLPAAFDWDYSDPADRLIRLAKVRLGLERISRGDFQLLDLAWSDGGDIELSLVQAIAWMVDVDVSHLQYRRDDAPVDLGSDEAGYARYVQSIEDEQPTILTSLEICSGAGGAALGFHAAGFSSVGLIEKNTHAVTTLINNRQLGPVIYKDVRSIDYTPYIGKIDLFAGGVPCQPHSVLGKQEGNKDTRDLFLDSVDIITKIRPRAVVLENVLGFSQRQAAMYRAKIFTKLEEAGYEAALFAIAASDYGLGQARPRLVLVAMRDGLMSRFKMPPILTPDPTTLGNALRDLMAENGWAGADAWAETANEPSPTIVGGSEKSGKQGFSSKLQSKRWEELGVDALAIANEAPAADKPLDHLPQLTLRMGAKLQGFPVAWRFKGPKREQRRQIANALPPIMACAVGLAIREALTGKPADYAGKLSQARIEAIGLYRDTLKSAVEVASELDLPLGDGYWKAFIDSWKHFRVPREDEIGKGLKETFFARYPNLAG